jgi:hypothetical protein
LRQHSADGALNQLELLLKKRKPPQQLRIRHQPRGGGITTAQSTDFLQNDRTNGRGGEPTGIRDFRHLLQAGAAPLELTQDCGLDLCRKQLQGKRVVWRHVLCSRLKRACDGRFRSWLAQGRIKAEFRYSSLIIPLGSQAIRMGGPILRVLSEEIMNERQASRSEQRSIAASPPHSIKQTMKTAAEYRKHAQERWVLAQQMPAGEQRNQLLEMARTWDNLAADREKLVRNHPDLDTAKSKAEAPSA